MIEKLRDRLKALQEQYKDERKYQLISEILEDENCFLKMDIEIAYGILRDLGIEEVNLKKVYSDILDESIVEK